MEIIIVGLSILSILSYLLKIGYHLTYNENSGISKTWWDKIWHIFYSFSPFPLIGTNDEKRAVLINRLTMLFWFLVIAIIVISVILYGDS